MTTSEGKLIFSSWGFHCWTEFSRLFHLVSYILLCCSTTTETKGNHPIAPRASPTIPHLRFNFPHPFEHLAALRPTEISSACWLPICLSASTNLLPILPRFPAVDDKYRNRANSTDEDVPANTNHYRARPGRIHGRNFYVNSGQQSTIKGMRGSQAALIETTCMAA